MQKLKNERKVYGKIIMGNHEISYYCPKIHKKWERVATLLLGSELNFFFCEGYLKGNIYRDSWSEKQYFMDRYVDIGIYWGRV